MLHMFVAQTKAESIRIIRSPFFLLFSIAMPLAFYFLFASMNGWINRFNRQLGVSFH